MPFPAPTLADTQDCLSSLATDEGAGRDHDDLRPVVHHLRAAWVPTMPCACCPCLVTESRWIEGGGCASAALSHLCPETNALCATKVQAEAGAKGESRNTGIGYALRYRERHIEAMGLEAGAGDSSILEEIFTGRDRLAAFIRAVGERSAFRQIGASTRKTWEDVGLAALAHDGGSATGSTGPGQKHASRVTSLSESLLRRQSAFHHSARPTSSCRSSGHRISRSATSGPAIKQAESDKEVFIQPLAIETDSQFLSTEELVASGRFSFLPQEWYTTTPFSQFPPSAVLIRKRDALALALASKQFLEPALDAIWCSLLSIKPLLDLLLLPATMAKERLENDEISDTMIFAEELEGADWRRYDYYARRVRYIKMSDDDRVQTTSYRALGLCSRQSLLLPNLRFLHWDHRDVESFYCLSYFSGPRLAALTINMDRLPESHYSALFNLFLAIRRSCPSLDELVVHSDMQRLNKSRQVALVLSALTSLKSVEIQCNSSSDTWACLVKMPNLRSLRFLPSRVRWPDSNNHDPPWNILKPDRVHFIALQHLMVIVDDVTAFIRFLASPELPQQLKTVEIHIATLPTPSDVNFLVSTLSSDCSLTTLSVFTITDAVDSTTPVLASKLLAPLLHHQDMEHFSWHWGGTELDNAFVEKVAAAWPKLCTLNLQPQIEDWTLENPNTSSITLSGLVPLVEYCHHLNSLSIAVTGSYDDVLAEHRKCDRKASGPLELNLLYIWDYPPQTDEQAELLFLNGCACPTEHLIKVEQFLKDIFPESSTIKVNHPHPDADFANLDSISDTYYVFAVPTAMIVHLPPEFKEMGDGTGDEA
ncbi:hypothetical protein EVG20_g3648 [Dentipellis fragilis]|uniref:Uncharacterized protein n=1 Tax=Dentipellis fragilis TaxID=205917 RepID=A0A4Y9Z051_9AGAM|nr:hypothetical protein EVG20_g3648 [Dentipellis fragilis]